MQYMATPSTTPLVVYTDESIHVVYNISNDIYIVYVMNYIPSSTNIVILGSVISTLLISTLPPIIINHTQRGPMINVDREWESLSVTESGSLICSM